MHGLGCAAQAGDDMVPVGTDLVMMSHPADIDIGGFEGHQSGPALCPCNKVIDITLVHRTVTVRVTFLRRSHVKPVLGRHAVDFSLTEQQIICHFSRLPTRPDRA